jgi:HAD superfamily hydrolase (TIGR01509 family)
MTTLDGRRAAALVFDFDGLILDTETPILEAWQAVYREHGCELRMEEWQHALGTANGFDPFGHLCELTGLELAREEMIRGVTERNWAHCERQPLLPGVVDVISAGRQMGLRLAVASSSPRAWLDRWLGKHGILDRFDALCGREDVSRVKPAPDLFLLAASRLGVPPAGCVVFEDSPNGMRAARSAGMRCVAVPNGLTGQLVLPDPDLVLSSLAERPLAEILGALGFETA